MFRTMLVPLDGSTFGEHALPYALSMARRTGAAVHLVHIYESLFDGVEGYGPLDQQGMENAQTYLAGMVKKLTGLGTLNISCKLLQGSITRALHDYAQEVRADFMVMCTHGRGQLARMWLGSVADRVVRRMPVPVLLVRPQEGESELHRDVFLRKILVPLDGSPFAEQILQPVRDLASVHQSALLFMHVLAPTVLSADEPLVSAASALDPLLVKQLEALQAQKRKNAEAYLRQIAEQFQGKPGQASISQIEDLQPAAAIKETAATQGVDVIAMATHGRGGFSRLFLGSVADKVVRTTDLPVLLYHPPSTVEES